MALVAPRKIVRLAGTRYFRLPVAAGAVILQSALVILDDGFARAARQGQGADTAAKAADALTHVTAGVASEGVTGGVANGDAFINVERDCFGFKNSAGADEIVLADVGKSAFVIDDDTVAKTSGTLTRARAGVIEHVEPGTVWVSIGKANFA